jgi:hypothetical protein
MEEELLSALDELRKYKTRYRQLKSFVVEQKEKHEQKEEEMEKLMSNLKNQILEANRIEESLEKSLKEKQITCERMEAEIVHLRKELDTKLIQTRYENSSKILDKIITTQRDSGNKNGIGYSQEKIQVNSKSYADALLSTFKKKNKEKTNNDQNSRGLLPPIKKENKTIPKKVYQNRYPHIFFGYCFACSNFRHKAMNCRAYRRKDLKVKNYNLKDKQAVNRVKRRNYNSFAPLQEGDLECFRCHNYGHKAINCRLMEVSEQPKFIREQKKLWREKTSKRECLIALKAQDKEDLWYVDSGCSKHMTGNKDKFLDLKKQKGKVTFGDNASGNILGKGTVSLGKTKPKMCCLLKN